MQIPQKLIDFLQGPTFARAGTRDADNIPACHLVIGVRVADDREHLTFLVHELATHRLRENLAHNGRVALTAGANNQSYQVKGLYTEVRPPTPEEHADQRRWLQSLTAGLAKVGYPASFVDTVGRIRLQPCVAVTMRVDEIFDQHPGPGAGERLPS